VILSTNISVLGIFALNNVSVGYIKLGDCWRPALEEIYKEDPFSTTRYQPKDTERILLFNKGEVKTKDREYQPQDTERLFLEIFNKNKVWKKDRGLSAVEEAFELYLLGYTQSEYTPQHTDGKQLLQLVPWCGSFVFQQIPNYTPAHTKSSHTLPSWNLGVQRKQNNNQRHTTTTTRQLTAGSRNEVNEE